MSYPEIDDEFFYDKLNNKMEFYENRIDNVKTGLFLEPNQNYVGNYLSSDTIYNSLLLYHSTGVGKSISAINIISQNKDKPVLVLIKNKSIEQNFKNQIDRFQSEMETEITDIKYINYGAFVNRTLGTKGSEVINGKVSETRTVSGNKIENLSDYLIIVDEVHNILNNEGYRSLRYMLDKSKNYKLLLLSATPIFDNVKEIFELSNLLNDKYSQLPIRESLNKSQLINTVDRDETNILSSGIVNLSQNGVNELKEKLRGKISYLTIDPSTFPRVEEKGTIISKPRGQTTLKVIKCKMSQFQYEGYKKAINIDTNNIDNPSNSNAKKSSLFKNASDASTIIYPNGGFGKEGFQSIRDKNFLKKNNIRQFSQKLYNILENVEKSNGPVLIYSEYVTAGGTQLLEMFFRANGYGDKMAVLHANIDMKQREKIRRKYNSKNNSNGQLIKVLIGSQVISEGINFKRIRQIHILEPAWNLSRIQQIIGRGVRNRSHQDLDYNEQKVEIYKYISISENEDKDFVFIDEIKYILSEDKDKSIKKVERLLKTIAIDCSLNRPRNIINGVDGSRECDYDVCDYTCEGKGLVITGSDNTTNKYSKNTREIKFVSDNLIDVIEKKEIISLDDILKLNLFDKINDGIIYEGIQYIIDNNIILNGKHIKGTLKYLSGLGRGDSYYFIQPIELPVRSLFDFFGKKKTRENKSIEDYTLLSKGKIIEPKILVRNVKTLSNNQDSENIIIKQNLLYGTKSDKNNVSDGIFRIVDNRKNNLAFTDNRKTITGKTCSFYTVQQLKDILLFLQPMRDITKKEKKDDMCNTIESFMTDNNLILN
jgi:superfamily II DNA or RNA helicase